MELSPLMLACRGLRPSRWNPDENCIARTLGADPGDPACPGCGLRLAAPVAAATRRHSHAVRPQSAGGYRARPLRRAAHLRRQRRGCVFRARLRPRPGPLVADGNEPAHRQRTPVRGAGPGDAGRRQVPAHPGRAPRGRGHAEIIERGNTQPARRVCGRGQRVPGATLGPLAAGVPAHRGQARALAERRFPRLGQDDGLGPGRQLAHRVAAHAPGEEAFDRADRRIPAAVSGRRAAGDRRLRRALPPARREQTRRARAPRADRGRRLQQLGGRRQPHGERQAAARQRSAPGPGRPRDLVLRPSVGARPRRDGGDAARRARRRAGAQPAYRLGFHQHRPGRAGPVHRARRRRRPGAGAAGMAEARHAPRSDQGQGPART